MGDVPTVLLIGGAYSGALVGLIVWLSSKRQGSIDRLDAKISAAAEEMRATHRALASQVSGMATDMGREFVRKNELDGALATLRVEMSATRNDIHEVRGMIFAFVSGQSSRKPRGTE